MDEPRYSLKCLLYLLCVPHKSPLLFFFFSPFVNIHSDLYSLDNSTASERVTISEFKPFLPSRITWHLDIITRIHSPWCTKIYLKVFVVFYSLYQTLSPLPFFKYGFTVNEDLVAFRFLWGYSSVRNIWWSSPLHTDLPTVKEQGHPDELCSSTSRVRYKKEVLLQTRTNRNWRTYCLKRIFLWQDRDESRQKLYSLSNCYCHRFTIRVPSPDM